MADPTFALPAVMDLEASGFGRGSYPIEIGYVLPDGSGWCTLVRPEPRWTHWDDAAQRLHGIARDTALRHGRPATEVAQALNGRLQGLTLYSDGWNDDYTWLGVLFESAGISPNFKLQSLRALLSEDEAAAWHEAKQQLSHSLGAQRHRASTDARLLQRTYAAVRDAAATPPPTH